VTGIWTNRGSKWELASAEHFPDEATLHNLVEENPALLPLAGSPRLLVLGREVQLGTGYADLLAVEANGRPVIIEVKLAKNTEARRAIVSQVLSYAAFLQGHTLRSLEQGPLRRQLAEAGHQSILEAIASSDQEGAVDQGLFESQLDEYLGSGHFRLVLVLDEIPSELERLVAYLDAVTERTVLIDLVTVDTFDVNGVQIALPQRITPNLAILTPQPARSSRPSPAAPGVFIEGSELFDESIADSPAETRDQLNRLLGWGKGLGSLTGVKLFTYQGATMTNLLPYLMPDKAGLVSIYNEKGRPSISLWRSVFERRAPNSIAAVEAAIAPSRLGQGTTIRDLSDDVLEILAAAYAEASESR
jgi:hypothetical protein